MSKTMKWFLLLPLCALMASCAVHPDEEVDEVEQRIIDAYVYNNPGYTQTAYGFYYKIEQQGIGSESPKDQYYVYVNYTGYDLKGNVVVNGTVPYTNSDSIAKQLGTFAYTTYYGPRIWGIGHSTLYKGLEIALTMMTLNEKMRIIMPSWLSTIGSNTTRSFSAPVIIDIELLTLVKDIAQYQTYELADYSRIYYNGMDSLKKDWFYKDLVTGSGEQINYGDTAYVKYIGYLLDGFVFDTNIADSASQYHIYDKTKSYDVLAVVLDSTKKSTSESTVISGFMNAILKMRDKGESVTFFSSNYGYGSTGSGQIQPYSPLCFKIQLEGFSRKKE